MTTETVGIIGDGQLGMLLCQAAHRLDIRTVMLTGSADSPAARDATTFVVGAMDDREILEQLIEICDVITYEREDVPTAAIAQLREGERSGRVRCFPGLDAVEIIQDKATQKRWLADKGLATLPFAIVDDEPEKLREAAQQLGFPVVQKALRGGFDGRGVQILRSPDDLARAWPGKTLLEQFAGEFTELAVLVARDARGNDAHYGPVSMTFDDEYAVLDTVCAPAFHDDDTQAEAIALARQAIDALDGVGIFGVEMFALASGGVVINEISPRVHNAGHYTLEACACSQFEQHLRAILGLPLGDTSLRRPAAMRNLLCTEALSSRGVTEAARSRRDKLGSTVYWYGKSPARAMRKLGHITALGDSAAAALAQTQASWQKIQDGEDIA